MIEYGNGLNGKNLLIFNNSMGSHFIFKFKEILYLLLKLYNIIYIKLIYLLLSQKKMFKIYPVPITNW